MTANNTLHAVDGSAASPDSQKTQQRSPYLTLAGRVLAANDPENARQKMPAGRPKCRYTGKQTPASTLYLWQRCCGTARQPVFLYGNASGKASTKNMRLEGKRIGKRPHWNCGAQQWVVGSSPMPSARILDVIKVLMHFN